MACLTRQRIFVVVHAQVDQPVGEVLSATLVATSWCSGVFLEHQPHPFASSWASGLALIGNSVAAPANPAVWGRSQAIGKARNRVVFAAAVFRPIKPQRAPSGMRGSTAEWMAPENRNTGYPRHELQQWSFHSMALALSRLLLSWLAAQGLRPLSSRISSNSLALSGSGSDESFDR